MLKTFGSPSGGAWSQGRRLRYISQPAAAMAATTAPRTRASLTSSQRRRDTLCAQAKRWVPRSSSLANSGAPSHMPRTAGTMTRPRVSNWVSPAAQPAGWGCAAA